MLEYNLNIMKLPKDNLSVEKRFKQHIAFVFLLLGINACKNDNAIETMDLVLPLNSYYISEGDEIMISIVSGNNKYTLITEQEDLIQANYSPTYTPFGNIRVSGLKKGKAQLSVQDDVTGQLVNLEIHVVDPYLVIRASHVVANVRSASYEISNNTRDEMKGLAAFGEGEILIIQRNANRQYFLFEGQKALAEGTISKSGNYTLEFGFGGPNKLSLLNTGDNGTHELNLYVPSGQIFFRLLEFARSEQTNSSQIDVPENIQLSMEVINKDVQLTSPVTGADEGFYIYKDWTDHFRETQQDIEVAESFQAMLMLPINQHILIGEGILL